MINTLKQPHRVKARKEHKCDMCGKLIAVGELYESATYSCDGTVYDWKTCDRCKAYVNEAFSNKDYCWDDGMSEEDFREYMINEHTDIAEEWWN